MVTVHSTLLIFVLLLIILTANAKFCAKCDGVRSPDLCITYAKCNDSEECYAEEKLEFGVKTFKLGCLSSTICQHLSPYLFGRSVNKRQTGSCVQCCWTDGCNTRLCKDDGFTLTTNGSTPGFVYSSSPFVIPSNSTLPPSYFTSVWQKSNTTTTPPTSFGGKTTLSSSAANGYSVNLTTTSSSYNGVTCDFEYGMCHWYQDRSDDFDWIRGNGLTPSAYTGPSNDHTTQTVEGHYLYTESSRPRRAGDMARIFSPFIPAADAGCFQFWYNMYGSTIGSLSVMVNNKVLWDRNGNQGNIWMRADINIKSNTAFNITIQATLGSGYFSDIAIDDILFQRRKC